MEIAIPYNVEPRKETGLYNAKLGIWLFIASEVMLFGALFSSYILMRVGNAVWPPVGTPALNIPLATFNTAVLITSSITVLLSWTSLKAGLTDQFKKFFGFTLLLGLTFLVAKSFEYHGKWSHGIFPKTNVFMALYYTMTFLHVLHVIGGMVVMAYFWGPGFKMYTTEKERFINRIETIGLYWHFVDLVWIFLFPTLYLI